MTRDGTKGGEKALGMTCRFDFPHVLLTESLGLVGIFCSIVHPFLLAMHHPRQNLSFRDSITGQFICDNHARHVLKPASAACGRTFLPPSCCVGFASGCQARCHPDRRLARGSASRHESSEHPHRCTICRHSEDGDDAIHLHTFAQISGTTAERSQRTMPRSAIRSSISRKLSEKRKESQTQ